MVKIFFLKKSAVIFSLSLEIKISTSIFASAIEGIAIDTSAKS